MERVIPPAVAIVDEPLSVDDVLTTVSHPGAGGVVVFIGTVRDHDGEPSNGVSSLDYSAHPQALAALERVATEVADLFPDVRLAASHRVGHLQVGDLAVVLAASAPHRDEAFRAARRLIDDLKAGVPIWKHQTFSDGSDEWVGLP
jgi:molybdopterin synthase catalytic subunit